MITITSPEGFQVTLNKTYAEVLEATKLTIEKHGAASPMDVHSLFFKNQFSYKYIANIMNALGKMGVLAVQQEKICGTAGKFYGLAEQPPTVTAPSPPGRDSTLDEQLNVLIDNLELFQAVLQETIPSILSKLLDLSKMLDRFRKVQEIMVGMQKIARLNV